MERLKRKDPRLAGFDYSTPGGYFITICTKARRHLFWSTERNAGSDTSATPACWDRDEPTTSSPSPCGDRGEPAVSSPSPCGDRGEPAASSSSPCGDRGEPTASSPSPCGDRGEPAASSSSPCGDRGEPAVSSPSPCVGADIIRPVPCSLSRAGQIVECVLLDIPNHYPNVKLGPYVIMPNHIHVVIELTAPGRMISAPTKSIPTIIGQFKRVSSMLAGAPLWQKGYHDHIIRNDDDYRRIWQYIDANPAKWREDRYYEDGVD